MTNFQWTDDAVKTFAHVYCANPTKGFEYSKYRGKKIQEKIELFKEDYNKLTNRYVVVSNRMVFHKYAEIKVQIPDDLAEDKVNEWLMANEDKWVDKLNQKARKTRIEYGFGLERGMVEQDQVSETRFDVILETPQKTKQVFGGHL